VPDVIVAGPVGVSLALVKVASPSHEVLIVFDGAVPKIRDNLYRHSRKPRHPQALKTWHPLLGAPR
jgi:hypothetical protein